MKQYTIKVKILIILLAGILSLLVSVYIYRDAFSEIGTAVDQLSGPRNKVRNVNRLFAEIMASDNIFREMVSSSEQSDFIRFVEHSDLLEKALDNFRQTCLNEPELLNLVDSVGHFVKQRRELLTEYVLFRQSFKTDKQLFNRIQTLDSVMLKMSGEVDSVVFSQALLSTRIDTLEKIIPKEKRSFWNRLFGAREKEEERVPLATVEERREQRTDTLLVRKNEDVSGQARELINSIREEQIVRRKRFYRREATLLEFEKSFTGVITLLLVQIGEEAEEQELLMSSRSEEIIENSMLRMAVVALLFVLFNIWLLIQVLSDIRKNRQYNEWIVKAKEEAEAYSLARQRFLSNMSHEIRTPLQSILGFSEQLKAEDEAGKKRVRAIQQAAGHLLEVVNEILDFSKMQSGKTELNPEPFDLKELLFELDQLLGLQAQNKGLDWTICLPQENAILLGDPFRLKQVLLNLAGNAIKYTEEGEVKLYASVSDETGGKRLSFAVEDTGRGMDEEQMQRIFNEFEQAGAWAERKGSGLGLTIASGLVHQMGGQIEVRSWPGQGSVFSFEIVLPEAETVSGETKEIPMGSIHPDTQVWVLDDDTLILEWLSDLLSKHQLTYRVFSGSQELLDAFQEGSFPDLLLMDIRLPGLSGVDLLTRIHELVPSCRVVAMTAQVLPEEINALRGGGFEEIIFKPFQEHDLLRLLAGQESSARDNPVLGFLSGNATESLQELMDEFWQLFDVEWQELCNSAAASEERALLLHRLASRFAQFGMEKPARLLREAEWAVRRGEETDLITIEAVCLQYRKED